MRKLCWLTLGFAIPCAIGTYFAPGLLMLPLAAASFLLCGALGFFQRVHWAFRASMLVCLGLAIGACWFCLYDGIYLQPARLADGTVREITLHVTDYPTQTDYGCYVDGKTTIGGKTYGCRLYLTDPEEAPQPGTLISVSAELRLTTDGGQNDPTHHRSGGIFLLAYGKDKATLTPGEETFSVKIARFRQTVNRTLQDIFPEDTSGFARALLLGDKSSLGYTQRNNMSQTGISHVAAVSGMHLSIAFALVSLLTMKRRFLSALLGIPAAFLFAAVAGFSPSVCRAAIMLALSLTARAIGRDYDPPTALAFGSAVLLICNPTTIASIGFQLSVGAVAGIFCFTPAMLRWTEKVLPEKSPWSPRLKPVFSAMAVTLGATVFTAPLGAVHFGVISLVAPITNLLTLWAVTLAFYGVLFAVLLAWVWLPLGRMLAWVIRWLLRYVLGVSQLLGRFPLAAVYPEDNLYVVVWVVFALVLLAVFLLMRCQGKAVFSLSLVFALLLAVILPCLEPMTDAFRVTVLDVGQGQCVLLQHGGRVFMVDCGGTAAEGAGETAARALLTQGITRIDGVILTHYDADHTSGFAHFLSRIRVDALYLPLVPDEPDCRRFGAMAKKLYYITEDWHLSWGEAVMQIFAPQSNANSNDGSVSVLFTVGTQDTLITGDMGASAEENLLNTHNLPDIELLLAGHHGSKHSTTEAILSALRPEILVISVGKNSYGHPAQEVLQRAADAGCLVLRTDEVGTVVFTGLMAWK
ncbi:MAG: DNA internalization-related competence protein ComEC/Rec2 [Ruminococcaceae bacterium]|nr:DNA internalization-related competence protein ComEC/Rec2 [Oscillospiraceae bacterium]